MYYKIWVDCITKLRSIPANQKSWKRYSMIFMSMAMAINFAMLMAIFQRNILGKYFYHFEVDFFPGTKLDAFISGFILFVLPNVVLNYFLIFRKNRYNMLLKKYKYYNGKLFLRYFFTSLGIPFLILILSQILY